MCYDNSIAQGKNTRSELEKVLNIKELSGYLKNLCEEYGLISKMQPIFEKSGNKNVHYMMKDQFLRFWFRFVYKYTHIIVAEDEVDGKIQFIEVKLQAKNYDEETLRVKSDAFLKSVGKFTGYDVSYRGLSMDDM